MLMRRWDGGGGGRFGCLYIYGITEAMPSRNTAMHVNALVFSYVCTNDF